MVELLRRLQTNQTEEMGKAIEEAAKTLMETEYSRKFDEQNDKEKLELLKQVLKQTLEDLVSENGGHVADKTDC